MKITEEQFHRKLINAVIHLYDEAKKDRLIYGDAFIKLGDRKIELLNPQDVIIKTKKGRGKPSK